MTNTTGKPDTNSGRVFLFLQGPHGPFFSELAQHMQQTGARCWRVVFNAGDGSRWQDRNTLLVFHDRIEDWPAQFATWIEDIEATDIVLYGDTRRHHAEAIAIARKAGLTVHVFEEGYLRPYWATYEREGSNGNSRLMQITLAQMEQALTRTADVPALPPDQWGDLRMHMVHGALYHWHVLFRNHGFPHYRPHRDQTVAEEFRLHLLRLLRRPRHMVQRWAATRHIRKGGWPFHVVLLQLEHDASFRSFSGFESQTDFVEMVISEFARGAPPHHRLVFKAHPLEDGRAPLEAAIRASAEQHGLSDRVFFVKGGKLAYLLASARSAVTVNSTSAHQALWRGLPVRSFGTSVYDKASLVSHQPLSDFFAEPTPPNPDAYAIYRQFLLETSQLPGGFYSSRGRAQLLRQVVDRMLDPVDPYDHRLQPQETKPQHLRLVRG
ncbi:capsule biosynthesis protein [Marivita geojedonensis]|uniref:Capsule biosynthesis protein CapA n=1 Tax=Marivita geojedonensis TaxID=1123756 RepID=A0A1X4NHL6_9RHOB|nr:capsule biosynthesis protein CapA [Marivita geojedonensis]OSQ47011.1 capsule biosynthesis protein CapA [Marivita geojedonensis]PRY74453.1 capsular polysaccharide export protein [Marivita geojedonensis]